MAAGIEIAHFADPACPWDFSAEPARFRLRWLYGDQIEWRDHLVVLSESPDEYVAKGFTPEVQERALAVLQRRFSMPIDLSRRPRMMATIDACRAVVAARVHGPAGSAEALLRRLRMRAMAGDLLDEPQTIALAADEAGIEPDDLREWLADPAVELELRFDMAAARLPSRAARALDHKLAPVDGGRRYTCPSYEIEGPDGRRFDAPGFQPVEVYEAAIANLAPQTERRAEPESPLEVLEWAGEPLATAEVAAVCGAAIEDVRPDLEHAAYATPVGPEAYWSLLPSSKMATPAPGSRSRPRPF
ncbi:MAG: DsbA family protein [Thermoleophilaceae bacterium]